MSDIRQTTEWANYLSQLGWKIVKLDHHHFLHIKPLPFHLSYIKIPRPGWPLDLKVIDKFARQNHALLIKITPNVRLDDPKSSKIHAQLLQAGYIKEYWTQAVTKTMVIDLIKSELELFKNFSPKTRQYINLAKRNGVKIIQSDDINLCYQLYVETAQRNHFSPASYEDIITRFNVFKKSKKVLLLFALAPDNKPVATLLILLNSSKKQAFCSVAGTSNTYRNLRASYLLHWETMLKAKKLMLKTFDFDGIYDEKYLQTKTWSGFTFFKRGFRGKEISYLGSYIKIYNPILKFLFSLIIRSVL